MSMAGDLNVVTLVGRLTRDSEIRYSQKGDAVVRFSIALNRRKRNVDGSWEDEANFFNCVYFGKSLKETIEFILSNYDGITEAYITGKYNSFSSSK